MSEKIGLVLEGGGMRGAYTAGALAWLNDHHITFDYSVGISSGAVYLSCFLVNDKHTPYNMSVYYASSDECVGLKAFQKEGYYVAYKYIFEECLLAKEHMDIRPLIENPEVIMEVGAYDLSQGKTVYFNNHELDPELVLLRGTCALPVASAVVEYKGRRLLDGGITKMIPIERALEQGCTKCMVITTKPKDYVRKPASPIVKFLMKQMYKECPQAAKDYEVRHINYYRQMDIIRKLVEDGKGIYILPSENVKVSRFHGDVKNTKKLYSLGYRDMEARKEEIFRFLGKEENS